MSDLEKKKESKKAERKTGYFREVVAEFKKIIWPNRNSLVKRTVAVIVSSVLLGAVIALIDLVVKFGLEFLVK